MFYSYRSIVYLAFYCSTFFIKAITIQKTDFFVYHHKENHPSCGYDKQFILPKRSCWKSSSLEDSSDTGKLANMAGTNGFYRPRSALARAFYEKQRNDRHLQELDQNEWYRVDSTRLSPELRQKFVQLHSDEETKEFLSTSIDKSSWVWTQIWYLLAKAVLKHFWSITDINGWLGRGSMFVLSEAQARLLLHSAKTAGNAAETLVDVGAGDGEVSRRFANLYSIKYATEISGSMRKALSNKGYTLLDTEEWWREQQFDCVCMLNLLDRCSKPKTMLKQARAALAPGGVLMLALVLPYKPYVEVTPDHKPEERLPIQGENFEEQLSSFVEFMGECGFQLSSWTRTPYLCEGDFAQAYYWLDDSVYVFTPKPIESHT
ncbi:protein-L-histidine N-pros-methyltransferase isoform X1 [Achroia grisella]|uniref:protein-L-histidine N-pros-methyltransferase isoform X1 n=1 Tax=Achroia grisella TaxID=688607 RepID=UPI0027D26819|nr:protein-L-histidine N-pros-methyltransferase isoform X1 [Achroia grisella]